VTLSICKLFTNPDSYFVSFQFERFFMPLCHFPLSKNVVSLVECVYRKVSEAKFLVKTCLIVADGMLKRAWGLASA
jgi:hypothetical protein